MFLSFFLFIPFRIMRGTESNRPSPSRFFISIVIKSSFF
nr:MAG TPA: hypothetical protein [Caudoviricetes sp.]